MMFVILVMLLSLVTTTTHAASRPKSPPPAASRSVSPTPGCCDLLNYRFMDWIVGTVKVEPWVVVRSEGDGWASPTYRVRAYPAGLLSQVFKAEAEANAYVAKEFSHDCALCAEKKRGDKLLIITCPCKTYICHDCFLKTYRLDESAAMHNIRCQGCACQIDQGSINSAITKLTRSDDEALEF